MVDRVRHQRHHCFMMIPDVILDFRIDEYTLHDVEYGPVLIICGKNFRLALFSYFHTHWELGYQDHDLAVKRYRATTGTSRQLKKAIADIMADLTEVPIRACKYVTSKVSRALLGGQDAYVTSGIWRRPGLGVWKAWLSSKGVTSCLMRRSGPGVWKAWKAWPSSKGPSTYLLMKTCPDPPPLPVSKTAMVSGLFCLQECHHEGSGTLSQLPPIVEEFG